MHKQQNQFRYLYPKHEYTLTSWHVQVYPIEEPLDAEQAPPFWQGWDSHTLNLLWHLRPKDNILMVKLYKWKRIFYTNRIHIERTGWSSSCLTCEARLADTLVVIGQLDAIKTVCGITGVRETLIYVSLTSFSCESRGTIAAVSTHSIHTSAIIQALRRSIAQSQGWSTVIFIDLTENTFKRSGFLNITIYLLSYSYIVTSVIDNKHTQCARGAGADIMSHQINASASILAWMRLALIDFYFAILPSIAWHTL